MPAGAAGLTKRRAAAATTENSQVIPNKVKKGKPAKEESEEEEDDDNEEADVVDDDSADEDSSLDTGASAPVAPVHDPRRSRRLAREPTAAELEAEMRNSTKFVLLRSFLLVVIFFVLYTFTQWYILEPIFQPHRTASFKAQQEAEMRAKIARSVCPDGQNQKQIRHGLQL